jgi:hypothetical protein
MPPRNTLRTRPRVLARRRPPPRRNDVCMRCLWPAQHADADRTSQHAEEASHHRHVSDPSYVHRRALAFATGTHLNNAGLRRAGSVILWLYLRLGNKVEKTCCVM